MTGVYIDKVYTESADGYPMNSRGRIKLIEYADRFDVQTFDESNNILYWTTISKLTGEVSVGKFDPDGRIRVPKTWSE
jgi:hypothetical protein